MDIWTTTTVRPPDAWPSNQSLPPSLRPRRFHQPALPTSCRWLHLSSVSLSTSSSGRGANNPAHPDAQSLNLIYLSLASACPVFSCCCTFLLQATSSCCWRVHPVADGCVLPLVTSIMLNEKYMSFVNYHLCLFLPFFFIPLELIVCDILNWCSDLGNLVCVCFKRPLPYNLYLKW